jgi:A/G-specific adenine glycosylase
LKQITFFEVAQEDGDVLKKSNTVNNKVLETNLLQWYDTHQRVLPWRSVSGYPPNPYQILLSEIMLQQTTVATVKDYFSRFVQRWPTIECLAQATLDDIFHVWQGLGYYSRARNLHTCAQILAHDYKGVIPSDEKTLLTLPGIGPYTAAAIAAIAYNQPTIPVDGNIVRVFSRLLCLDTPLPSLKKEIHSLVRKMIPPRRSGDFAQALMDLGATICRPRNPRCEICPLQTICKGYIQGIAQNLPIPAPKEIKPQRYGIVFWIENKDQEILLEKRPAKGLLAGLIGLPTTQWREKPWGLTSKEMLPYAPKGVEIWKPLPKIVSHTFTHFHLELQILKGKCTRPIFGIWSPLENLKSYALPTVMKKVIQTATDHSV